MATASTQNSPIETNSNQSNQSSNSSTSIDLTKSTTAIPNPTLSPVFESSTPLPSALLPPPSLSRINSKTQQKNNNHLNSTTTTNSSLSPTTTSPITSASEAIFEQLNKIKSIQQEIALAHSNLEGIKSKQNWYEDLSKDKVKNESLNTSGIGLESGKVGKDKMKGSYEQMSKEFAERQINVDNIMIKLSSLSSALKSFHNLPAPELFPTSTTNTNKPTLNPRSYQEQTNIMKEDFLNRSNSSRTNNSDLSRPSYGRRLSYD